LVVDFVVLAEKRKKEVMRLQNASKKDLNAQRYFSMIHVHYLDEALEAQFSVQQRRDPITHEAFCVGERIVFCGCCKSAFLLESWEFMGHSHCNQRETLAELPKELNPTAKEDATLLATLGWRYLTGNGRPQQKQTAETLLRKAALAGNIQAAYNLAVCLEQQGQDREAVKWYGKSAKKGNAKAQFRLGLMLWEGRGISRNKKEALGCFSLAAQNGCHDALCHLGWMYEKG